MQQLGTFLEIIKQVGPAVAMFGFGILGIFWVIRMLMKWVSKADDKAKEAERKRDEMYSRLTEMVFETLEKNKAIEKSDHTEAVKHRKELIRKCNEYA
jgi:Zn-dependent protease with chaperone function